MRRVSVVVSIIVLLGIAYWAFNVFVNKQQKEFDPLSAIPADAFLIMEIPNGGAAAKVFYQRSMLWKDFEETSFAKEADPFFQFLDSLDLDQDIALSIHPVNNANHTLITIGDQNKTLKNLLQKYGKEEKLGERIKVITIPTIDFVFQLENEYIRIAKDKEFLKGIPSDLDENSSLLNDSAFVSIRSKVKKSAAPRLFINLGSLSENLNKTIIEDSFDLPKNLNAWLGSDLHDQANTIISSGFLEFDANEDHFFDAYEGQSAQGLSYFDILPANTALLTTSGFGNASTFLAKLNPGEENKASKEFFSSWLGNAYGTAVLSGKELPASLRFSFFKMRDLESFHDRIKKHSDRENATINYRNHSIQKLDSTMDFSCFKGEKSHLIRPYYVIIKDFVVMSSNLEVVKEVVRRYINDNTLSLQESFSNLRGELSDETSYLFYISPAMSNSFFENHLNDSLYGYWLPKDKKLSMLQAMIVQLSSYKKGRMYMHTVLRHQAVNFEEKDNSLWELYVDAPLKGDVHLLRNHYTQHLEIGVQDSSNAFYLINNKGEILWKKDLDGEIIGKVHQIDIYKNGKLQLLFNTKSKLYCIDRAGNNVEKYPRALHNETNLPLALFDYDDRKEYRIAIGFPNGSIDMYNGKGDELRGWKFKKVRSAITETPVHIRIGKKDYIYTSTKNGTILLLDRTGKPRYKSKINIAEKSGNANIYTGRSISSSGIYYIDSLGSVISVAFGGQKEFLPIKGSKGDHLYMARLNEDNSREFILYNSKEINVFDVKGNKLFDKINVNKLEETPNKFRFNKQNWLGYSDNNVASAYLIDASGKVKEDCPYSGKGKFRMADINKDGKMELVTKGENGQLTVYSLAK